MSPSSGRASTAARPARSATLLHAALPLKGLSSLLSSRLVVYLFLSSSPNSEPDHSFILLDILLTSVSSVALQLTHSLSNYLTFFNERVEQLCLPAPSRN